MKQMQPKNSRSAGARERAKAKAEDKRIHRREQAADRARIAMAYKRAHMDDRIEERRRRAQVRALKVDDDDRDETVACFSD